MPHRTLPHSPAPAARPTRARGAGLILASTAVLLAAAMGACTREPVAPTGQSRAVSAPGGRAAVAPIVAVGALLDSFSIGGVYTVLPRGGYSGGMSYTRSPEKVVYAGTIRNHPTGLEFPIGLPIRVLAEGSYVSRSTAAFQTGYCAPYGATDPICGIASFTWTVHGLMLGPGVLLPYDPGTGVALSWSRYAGYYDRFFGLVPSAEFYRGVVPAVDTATRRELHVTRARCCYYIPWGTTAAWETYEGVWRFGAVPDDGGQAELGVPAVLRLRGPRTDAPQAAPADFTVETTSGDSIVTTRWWYVRPANNSFDGERVDSVATGTQYPPYVPRYPDARRAAFTEVGACLGRRTCTYQAPVAGALVVQATLADGRVLAAQNTGASGAHVKITADTTTLTYGDTTVFRVTAPGASQWSVTGYSFRPVGAVAASAVMAVPGQVALRGARAAAVMSPEGVRVVRGRTTARFRDAALACSEATIKLCYDFPPQTGYEIVMAVVDGLAQWDSVLVRVVPALKLTCSDAHGVSDAKGGATVVRADTATCRASATEGLPTVTSWSFSSTGYPYSLTRSGNDDSTYVRDSTTWAGPMFTSGRVTVGGKVGGADQTASALVLVTARPWNTEWIDSTRWTIAEVPHPYSDPPAADSELGLNILSARRDYASSYLVVGQGPNQGLLAFTRFPVIPDFKVSVNYAAMRVGSKFYDMQPRSATGTYCSALTMVNSLPLVKKHEGFIPVDTVGPRLSHTFNYKRWFRKTLNDSVETLVDENLDSFGERIERLRVWGDSVAFDSSQAITHRQGSNPFTLPCRFNYDPAVRF